MNKLGAVVVMLGSNILADYYYKDGNEKIVAKQRAERKMHELEKVHDKVYLGYMETEKENVFN